MNVCILDGEKIEDKEALHDILSESLDFPAWYGRNLDALYDCLTDLSDETVLHIKNPEILKHNLDKYASSFIQVLERASRENPKVCIEIL